MDREGLRKIYVLEERLLKMIKINSNDGKQKIFESYNQACEYLNRIEKKKAIETGEINWMFIRRRHETISMLYYASPLWKNRLTPKEREAVEKQLGLIEIKKGSRENFTQILYRSFLDTEPLKRNWCYEYCKEHGFEITELLPRK
jgi:hypothetical protein